MPYVFCVKCENWYHDACIAGNLKALDEDQDFVCPFCTNAFPCGNSACPNKAYQVIGEYQSPFCSQACLDAHNKVHVHDALEMHFDKLPHLFKKESSDSPYLQALAASFQQWQSKYNDIKVIYEYYRNEIDAWPFKATKECGFDLAIFDALNQMMPLKDMLGCQETTCVRHHGWKGKLHAMLLLKEAEMMAQMDHCADMMQRIKSEWSQFQKHYGHISSVFTYNK